MKSVRITLDWGSDQQCIIDCAPQTLKGLTIAFQDRDGGNDGGNSSISEANRAPDREADGEDSIHVPDCADPLEVSDGRGFCPNYDGARNSLVSHGLPLLGRNAPGPTNQFTEYRTRATSRAGGPS